MIRANHAELLTKRQIIYAPDYLINSGGIINCNAELEHYSTKDVINKISKIYDTLDEVFEISDLQKISTHQAANTLAENRIYAKK